MSNNLTASTYDVSAIHFRATAVMAKITFLSEAFRSKQKNYDLGLSNSGCEGLSYVLEELFNDMSDLMSVFEKNENEEVR